MEKELITVLGPKAKLHEQSTITCEGSNNRLILKDKAKLGTLGTPKIEFIGHNNTLILEENTVVKRGHYRLCGDNNTIVIGKKTTINGAYMLCEGGSTIRIGEDCLLSYELEFRTTDAHSILDKTTGQLLNPPEDIIVGSHVWIGKGVCILQGVNLASNIIVGTRALVTKSFSREFIAIAGVPARLVRENVIWERNAPTRQND